MTSSSRSALPRTLRDDNVFDLTCWCRPGVLRDIVRRFHGRLDFNAAVTRGDDSRGPGGNDVEAGASATVTRARHRHLWDGRQQQVDWTEIVLHEVETSDETLAAMAAAGDASAFEEIVERYQGRAYWLACRLTENDVDALDVLQDTFLQVYLASFRGESQFGTCGRTGSRPMRR